MEVAIFVLRRNAEFFGSHVDNLDVLWNQEVIKYEKQYDKEHKNFNKGINW